MKAFGSERFMTLVPLAVLVLVVTLLAGGPGALIDILDRLARQGWEVLVGWLRAMTG